ncbi:DUF475 domain-containing protein [Microbacteriaceae bacterium]|nr:DUF475 domain-containing protein [Candidatus Saccharibacteria bacterium]
MSRFHNAHPLRIFWISGLLTIALGALVMYLMGISALWIFTILVILEVTFSFDNAVINSKILERMSPLWQRLFLTVGIIFAVFIVRFVLPVVIVMISSQLGFMQVIDLAMNHPKEYSLTLHEASPMINAFGGTFLMMIGVSYFMDRKKDIHWLGRIERWLSKFGQYDTFKVLVMLGVAMALYVTVDERFRVTVLLASIIGTMLHIGLELFGEYFASKQSRSKQLVGWAAFASFLYLNVLDASFSLDGVIGAFAITNDVILIMAGLGAGALWVRSLTVYLVRAKTLGKYRYLEHGAHWAILVLGLVMLTKLYHFEPPEWFTGSIGLIFVATAIVSSVVERRRSHKYLQ